MNVHSLLKKRHGKRDPAEPVRKVSKPIEVKTGG
jgi:hypothetical protein